MRGDLPVLEEQTNRRLADENQSDARRQTFPERRLDAVAENRAEFFPRLIERIGGETRENRRRQRDRENAERELVEKLRHIQPPRRAGFHRKANCVAEEMKVRNGVSR